MTMTKSFSFTPAIEMPFAGHPTVGTAALFAQLKSPEPSGDGDALVVLEEGIGPVRVGVRLRPGAAPFAEFDAPKLPQESGTLPPADRLPYIVAFTPRTFATSNRDALVAFNRALSRVPVLNLLATDLELVAVTPGSRR